ncbi:MAG: hypothetical protein WC456_01820 [Patescibacteria group bacterium]
MAKQKFAVTGDQYRTIHRKVRDIFRQLDQKYGSPLDPESVAVALQDIVNNKFNNQRWESDNKIIVAKPQLVQNTSCLQLIPGLSAISIPAADGKRIISEASGTFRGYIDTNFKKYGLDRPGTATKRAKSSAYELTSGATFKQMFTSFGVDLERLWLTQDQMISICSNQKNLRLEGYANFFLVKKDENLPATDDNLFVARVYVNSDGLVACVHGFLNDGVWYGEHRHRLFVPQLFLAA